MKKPFVGLPAATSSGCGFGGIDIDGKGCDADPVTHVAVMSGGWGLVSLTSCEAHAPIARSSGVLIDEHPYQPICLTTNCWFEETA